MREVFQRAGRFDRQANEEQRLREQNSRPGFPVSRRPVSEAKSKEAFGLSVATSLRNTHQRRKQKVTLPSLGGWGDNA